MPIRKLLALLFICSIAGGGIGVAIVKVFRPAPADSGNGGASTAAERSDAPKAGQQPALRTAGGSPPLGAGEGAWGKASSLGNASAAAKSVIYPYDGPSCTGYIRKGKQFTLYFSDGTKITEEWAGPDKLQTVHFRSHLEFAGVRIPMRPEPPQIRGPAAEQTTIAAQ